MQAVFEKIIEKLEERTSFLSDCTKYGNKDAEQQNKSYSTMMMYEVDDLVDDLIEIVKQEAEKFGTDTNVGSNRWILVSESLTCESGYYLVTYHEWSNGDYLPEFDDTYVRRLHYQRSKHFVGWNYPHCVDERAEADTNREVIAWRKLPTPYQPKGE